MKRVRRAEVLACPAATALERHRVEPADGWRGVTRGWAYPGRCHERAVRFLLANPEAPAPFATDRLRLVQGAYWPAGLGRPTPHSWVEVADDLVFDGVLQGFYRAAGYAAVLDARPAVSLTPAEACAALLRSGSLEVFDPLDCSRVIDEMVRVRRAAGRPARERGER